MIRSIAFLPETATADARVLVAARTVRAFGDGVVSALLAAWLKEIGLPVLTGRRDHNDDADRLGGVDAHD